MHRQRKLVTKKLADHEWTVLIWRDADGYLVAEVPRIFACQVFRRLLKACQYYGSRISTRLSAPLRTANFCVISRPSCVRIFNSYSP